MLERLDRERVVWLCTLRPDGDAPVVAEGVASIVRQPFPAAVVDGLRHRYDGWDVTADGPDGRYVLLRVAVARWLMAGRAH